MLLCLFLWNLFWLHCEYSEGDVTFLTSGLFKMFTKSYIHYFWWIIMLEVGKLSLSLCFLWKWKVIFGCSKPFVEVVLSRAIPVQATLRIKTQGIWRKTHMCYKSAFPKLYEVLLLRRYEELNAHIEFIKIIHIYCVPNQRDNLWNQYKSNFI